MSTKVTRYGQLLASWGLLLLSGLIEFAFPVDIEAGSPSLKRLAGDASAAGLDAGLVHATGRQSCCRAAVVDDPRLSLT